MSENFSENLPPQFSKNVLGTCGERGERWLNDLPVTIGEIAARWSLAVKSIIESESYFYSTSLTFLPDFLFVGDA